jgi:hypothetical protein
MEVVHFKDPREFQDRVLEYLAKREAENNLILGILANLIYGDYSDNPPYLAVFEDAGTIHGVSLCTPPWPTLVSYENPPPEDEVVKVMLGDMRASLQEDFTGLTGNKEFVTNLVSQWEKDTGEKAILKTSMRIYKLEEVQPVSGIPGRMRPAQKEDRKTLVDFFVGFQRDAHHEDPDLDRAKKQVDGFFSSDDPFRGLMIWEKDDQPVSMAGYAGPTPNGIRIAAVYTPPEMRRKGYASALTAAVSQFLLDQDYRFCFLFTDLLNPTSNHIYQHIGYQPVNDVDRYMLGEE